MVNENDSTPIDWAGLAASLGTLSEGRETSGSGVAVQALELILGRDAIRAAVDYYVFPHGPGAELARSVLWQIRPWSAMQRCLEIYEESDDVDARRTAIELLRVVADHRVVDWIDRFLDDPDESIHGCGAGIVDQLLWSNLVQPDACAHLLEKMKVHSSEQVRETYAFVTKYLRSREDTP
jgi:hypothetical protein